MIDADNKAVKPFGEIHPSKFFQEYLDSNCLMDLAQRMAVHSDNKAVKPFGEIHPSKFFQEYLDSNCLIVRPKKANLQRKHDVELARKRYKGN